MYAVENFFYPTPGVVPPWEGTLNPDLNWMDIAYIRTGMISKKELKNSINMLPHLSIADVLILNTAMMYKPSQFEIVASKHDEENIYTISSNTFTFVVGMAKNTFVNNKTKEVKDITGYETAILDYPDWIREDPARNYPPGYIALNDKYFLLDKHVKFLTEQNLKEIVSGLD